MFILSILFSQSIVAPIKILSNIVRSERDKSSKTINELKELLKDVDHIYFAGGEPLIMKKHYEILDFLIENNLNEKVFLRYNTNLSTLKYKNIKRKFYFRNVLFLSQ